MLLHLAGFNESKQHTLLNFTRVDQVLSAAF